MDQETATETYLRLLTCSQASLFASDPTSSPSAPPERNVEPLGERIDDRKPNQLSKRPTSYGFNVDPVDAFDWLKPLRPVARVGASLRLYYVAER
jgi:hypothetical protein